MAYTKKTQMTFTIVGINYSAWGAGGWMIRDLLAFKLLFTHPLRYTLSFFCPYTAALSI